MMTPIGNLLDKMSEARNALFPDLVRTRPDGSTYIECCVGGCRSEALDPQLHCPAHLDAAKREQSAKLAALNTETPEQRRSRRRREAVESAARRLACEAGQPARWSDRAFMARAQGIVEARMQRADGKGRLDDVY